MIIAIERLIGPGRRGLGIALALFALLVTLAWVGFIASDDVTYARGAYGWIEHFPFVGGHGTIRYPITLPMALSFLTFGGNEFAMVLPSLLYLIAFLAAMWRVTRDVAGPLPAFFALLACVTSPLLVVQASIANVDFIEMALLFGAWILCFRCLEDGPGRARLTGAGALVGLAFLARETAIFAIPFFGLLFLAGHRFNRWNFLWVAAGFLAVWSLELLYLGIMTGDPLYRFNISLNHDATIDRSIDLAGNVIVHPLVDPLLVLLINQEFMALMFFAVPLGAWRCFARSVPGRVRHFARLLALFGLVWFVCIGAAQHLLPLNPRYFMITATTACLITGAALGLMIQRDEKRWRRGGLAGLVLLVGTNLAGIYIENRDPAFGEEQLAAALAARPGERIGTDPMTRYRADLLLHWAGSTARASDAPPATGALFYYNPARGAKPNARMDAAAAPLYQPQPGWELVQEFTPAPSYLARALERVGADRRLPSGIWRKLRHPNESAYLYRVRRAAIGVILKPKPR
jgi:4-amino-4-deoxy-L-arabinose transferase-like glycosyltransferase